MTGAPGHEMPYHAHTHIHFWHGSNWDKQAWAHWRGDAMTLKTPRGTWTERQSCPVSAGAGRGEGGLQEMQASFRKLGHSCYRIVIHQPHPVWQNVMHAPLRMFKNSTSGCFLLCRPSSTIGVHGVVMEVVYGYYGTLTPCEIWKESEPVNIFTSPLL